MTDTENIFLRLKTLYGHLFFNQYYILIHASTQCDKSRKESEKIYTTFIVHELLIIFMLYFFDDFAKLVTNSEW